MNESKLSAPGAKLAALAALTALAMFAFAGNSLLCRLALKGTQIDAATFTFVRIASAALVLWLILAARGGDARRAGSWTSAAMLALYAAAFSYAYVDLPAGAGALLLFGAVQATMIGHGLFRGERLAPWQWLGLALALAGLVWLVLPGLAAPDAKSSALMIAAGVGWGVYSLRGRGLADPVAATAGNFLRAFPFAAAVFALGHGQTVSDAAGYGYALASGALTSGLGYVVWYAALKGLTPATAATVQLSVPVIAAAGGVALLGEALTLRLVVSSAAILGGIALVVLSRRRR
ncbi:DMT family transporter [Caballeronia sp. LZ062]|uniref:DMT family transporter n=1 Tax=unclassified Caballeronia TaxID=2646786 RepID=UPI00285EEC49|nr:MULTISPECIES: DMT family transporter [unclassified Caballeronia]MDR5854576.1 DMT family transporter [Caballeronia sp. LZ050]MDR5870895.1 DMT family transporter [Caballeronia sp. LZ062]